MRLDLLVERGTANTSAARKTVSPNIQQYRLQG